MEIICPKCGVTSDKNSYFCPICNYRFEDENAQKILKVEKDTEKSKDLSVKLNK